MSLLRYSKWRTACRRVWRSDRAGPFRFYARYLRWPLVLVLAALAGEKAIYFGALPLADVASREWSYFQAERAFQAGRDTQALYQIRQALLETRESPRLWRLAAQISDRLGSPEAAYCWQQVDQLEPGRTVTQLALAQAALGQGELELAAAALREVAPESQAGVGYLVAAGRLAEAQGDADRAGYFFTQAEALRPTEADALFALADWQVTRGAWSQARASLEALTRRPDGAREAGRKLIDLDERQRDLRAGRADVARLLALPSPPCTDRLRQLDFADDPETILARLLRGASPTDAALVLDWMQSHGRAEAALIWIREQDDAWQDDPAIGQARAGCLGALGEWRHLRDDQRDCRWAGHEAARLALLARASLALGRMDDALAAWHEAVAACADPEDFATLVPDAAVFPEADAARAEVWMALANRYPGQQWPLRSLLRYEWTRGDLVAAQNVAARLAALLPGDASVCATRDLLSLLRGAGLPQAEADLTQLEARQPGNPDVATAAAYSLYLQGRLADALATIGTLDPAELRTPDRAPYLGPLLAAAGPPERAEAILHIALSEPHLAETQQRDLRRALDLATTRHLLADWLHPTDAATRSHAAELLIAGAATGEPACRIGASVAELDDRPRAARELARIDPATLNQPELLLDEGAVLALADSLSEAEPWLTLSPDLPVEPPRATWHRLVETWWKIERAAPQDATFTTGLLNAYRGLDATEPDAAFWLRDEPRELALTRAALQAGQAPDAVQARLEELLHRVPATPEIEAQVGYALFLQGRIEAGRERLAVLSPAELARPEPARYAAAILLASDEAKPAARTERSGPPKTR